MNLGWLLCLLGDDKIKHVVRIKSWVPTKGEYGWEWPVMLVDSVGGSRQTLAPIWDRIRLQSMLEELLAKSDAEFDADIDKLMSAIADTFKT